MAETMFSAIFLSNRKVLEKNFLFDKNTTCKHVVKICAPRGEVCNCFAIPLGREEFASKLFFVFKFLIYILKICSNNLLVKRHSCYY